MLIMLIFVDDCDKGGGIEIGGCRCVATISMGNKNYFCHCCD